MKWTKTNIETKTFSIAVEKRTGQSKKNKQHFHERPHSTLAGHIFYQVDNILGSMISSFPTYRQPTLLRYIFFPLGDLYRWLLAGEGVSRDAIQITRRLGCCFFVVVFFLFWCDETWIFLYWYWIYRVLPLYVGRWDVFGRQDPVAHLRPDRLG